MKRNLLVLVLLAVFALLLLNVCSNQTESNTVEIRMSEFSFKPETIQLKAVRQVKVELVNEGKIEHEFMVGRGVKMEEDEPHAHEGKHENSEEEDKNHEGIHGAHSGKRFEKDFFEGIQVVAQTENGAEFMRVPRHGTMVTLKPESKAILTFKVPNDRKGEWEMACFVPGHYEAKMRGRVIIN